MVSSCRGTDMCRVEKRDKTETKPSVLQDYNINMGEVVKNPKTPGTKDFRSVWSPLLVHLGSDSRSSSTSHPGSSVREPCWWTTNSPLLPTPPPPGDNLNQPHPLSFPLLPLPKRNPSTHPLTSNSRPTQQPGSHDRASP
ncbi:hypothetical protein J437_LFUL017910 [Ladona fulva]|uniref:Uncharacterized protein n=1 Tax=Ladona fulva TaxID=123851 RepID=A0A8K0KIN0_LADFU|nr:hypothetical protein J437_LFUL017910 [Ladona fulva]